MAMNAYRLTGDACHLLSILIVLRRLAVLQTAHGLSVRTHELYLLVFVTRYLDLFTNFYSMYNSVLKVIYIGTTAYIIYAIRFQEPIQSTYHRGQDTFWHWTFAVAPCAGLALLTLLIDYGELYIDDLELFWTFSIYLESIAILPQLVVLQHLGDWDCSLGSFIFFKGAYRAFYILNWIHRAHTEPNYKHRWVVYFGGVVQTMIYLIFFGYIFKNSAFLRHMKDDSQPPVSLELEEPLLSEPSEIDQTDLNHSTREPDALKDLKEEDSEPPVDSNELMVV